MSRNLLAEALRKWGFSFQLDMVIEECAELILAARHHRRGRVDDNKLAEEVADVEIMCGQMREALGNDLVDQWKQRKMARLQQRLDGIQKVEHGDVSNS